MNEAKQTMTHPQLWHLATAVQQACYTAAVTAYENASTDGLCEEGAWECAINAMQAVDFQSVLNKSLPK